MGTGWLWSAGVHGPVTPETALGGGHLQGGEGETVCRSMLGCREEQAGRWRCVLHPWGRPPGHRAGWEGDAGVGTARCALPAWARGAEGGMGLATRWPCAGLLPRGLF